MNNDEVVAINKKEINKIFNEGMNAFLKDNLSIHECPYTDDQHKNMAWERGFSYAAQEFINNFSIMIVREMVEKAESKEQVIKPSIDFKTDQEVIEIVEKT